MISSIPIVVHLAYGGVGGHSTVIQNLARIHREIGVQSVGILVSNRDETIPSSEWAQLDCAITVPVARRGDAKSMLLVAGAVRTSRACVVVAHTHRHLVAAWTGMVIAGRRPCVVLAEHQAIPLRTRTHDLWSLIGVLLSRGIVLLTPDYLARYRWRRLALRLHRNIAVIPNGVPLQPRRDGGCDRTGWLGANPVIGMASRLIPSKDLSTLIEAVAILRAREHTSRIQLRIAGDGPDRPRLEKLARDLGIESSIDFLGRLGAGQMRVFYRSLDAYVQASSGETLSMTVLEAGSFGLPVVASDVAGLNDLLVDGDTGVLVCPQNSQALADGIYRALTTPRLGYSLRKLIESRYSDELVAVQYLEFLGQLTPALEPCLSKKL